MRRLQIARYVPPTVREPKDIHFTTDQEERKGKSSHEILLLKGYLKMTING